MRNLFLLSTLIILSACSLYESEGRKIFNQQGKSLIEAQSFESLDEASFRELSQGGFYDCEKIDVEEAHYQLDPENFKVFRSDRESFYLDKENSLALITTYHQSFESCLF